MNSQTEADSSINEILEMLKNYKSDANKSNISSELDFQSSNSHHPIDAFHFNQWLLNSKRQIQIKQQNHIIKNLQKSKEKKEIQRSSIEKINMDNSTANIEKTRQTLYSPFLKNNRDIFNRLYEEKKELDHKKCKLEYQNRKSIEEKQQKECTFSPNLSKSKSRFKTHYDSIDNQSFYVKNLQWQSRKQKEIKLKQCEKNIEKTDNLTFTPKINKYSKRAVDKQNKIVLKKGVDQYLTRLSKAKEKNDYIQSRKKNPYSHVWNIKQGHFSYIK